MDPWRILAGIMKNNLYSEDEHVYCDIIPHDGAPIPKSCSRTGDLLPATEVLLHDKSWTEKEEEE